MAATFTETLQLHYGAAYPELRARLIDSFKPDYIFITVVERDSRESHFSLPPPEIWPAPAGQRFSKIASGKPSGANDLSPDGNQSFYRVAGKNPYIIFSLSQPILPKHAPALRFNLDCRAGQLTQLEIRVFWHGAHTDFNHDNSVKFYTNSGTTVIDLEKLPTWIQSDSVTHVRLDVINPPTECSTLKVQDIALGDIIKS